MSARRFTGLIGCIWVIFTAAGIALYSSAGAPPSFESGPAYAGFTADSATFFLLDGFETGISAALLLALFAGLGAVFDEAIGRRSLESALLSGFGIAAAVLLAAVGFFEVVTVNVSQSPTHSGLTAPLWLVTETTLVFLYFFGAGAMATLSAAILKTSIIPAWTGWLCAVATVLLAVASLAALGGTGPMGPLGLAQVLVGFLPSAIALLALSVILVRATPNANPQSRPHI